MGCGERLLNLVVHSGHIGNARLKILFKDFQTLIQRFPVKILFENIIYSDSVVKIVSTVVLYTSTVLNVIFG